MIKKFIADESGASAMEYGLIAAVLSMTILAGMGRAFNALGDLFTNNQNELNKALN